MENSVRSLFGSNYHTTGGYVSRLWVLGVPHFLSVLFSKDLSAFAYENFMDEQICLGLNANEIQISYDKQHKVSSLVKSYQNTHNSVEYEVI